MVSIIIPVYNEEKTIDNMLNSLLQLEGEKELIVVDGGSTDKTLEIIKSHHVQLIESELGRAIQMNHGAKMAKGDILWFLHSDSKISRTSLADIEETIQNNYIGGCFTLTFYDADSYVLKIIEIGSSVRVKLSGLIFGDQGLFVKKSTFDHMGAFPKLELMEDFEFSLQLKKLGKLRLLKSKIGTSSRRFKKNGIIKTFFLMQKLKLLYILGVSPSELKKLYKEDR